MASIDSLTIEINASAAKAMPQLDQMVTKLGKLSTALKKTSGTNGFKSFQTSANKFTSSATKASSSLRTLNTAASKTSSGMKSLGSSLASLYVKFKSLQRAAQGLSSSMLSSMNFIETYHYFDVAMSKIGKDNRDQWAAQGYESAEAYAKSFSERALQLNEKMSGFTYDENGYATSTGQKNLGLSPGMLMQYQAQFAQMADSIGMTGEAALATSKAMTMLAGDWSSLKNISFETSFEKMTSALAGQSRAVRTLGIDITQGALQMQLYNLGFDVSISKLSQAQKSELRMIAILEQSKVAYGDLAKTLNTPANQFRMLQQNIQSLSRTIGNLFLPIIQKVLPYINGFVITLQRAFQWIAGFVGIDIGSIVKSSTSGGTGLEALEDLEDETDDLADAFADADKEAKKLKRTILGFDELNVLNDPNSGSSGSSSSKTAIGSAIDQAALDQALFDALAEYEKVWNAAFDKMESRALTIADDIAAGWQRVLEVIRPTIDAFSRLWDEGLSRLASFTWGTLGDFYHGFLVPVARWTMGEGLPRFFDVVNNFLIRINFEGLRESLAGLYEVLSKFAVEIGKGLIDFYEDLLGIGEGFINQLPGWIGKLTDELGKIKPETIRKVGYALGVVAAAFTTFKLLTGVEAIILGLSTAVGVLAAHPFAALSLGMGALYVVLSKYEGLHVDFTPVADEFDKLIRAAKAFKDAIPWEDIKQSATGLFEAISRFGVNFAAGFVGFVEDLVGIASRFAAGVPAMFDSITSFFECLDEDTIQKIGYAIGAVSTALAGYVGLTAVAGIIAGIAAAFGAMASSPFATLIVGGAAVYAVLHKFDGLEIDFSLVTGAFERLKEALENFKASVPWGELKEAFDGLYNNVSRFGVKIGAGLIDFLSAMVDVAARFVSHVPGMLDTVSAFFGDLDVDFTFISDGIKAVGQSISSFLESVDWTAIATGLAELINAFAPFVRGFADGLIQAFDVIVNDIGAPAINAVGKAINKVSAALKKVDGAKIEAAGTALGYVAAGLLAFKGLSAAVTVVSGLGTAIGGLVGHPYAALALGLGSVFLALNKFGLIDVNWEVLRKGFDDIKNAAVRLKSSINWEGLASSIAGIAAALAPFVEGFGDGFISFMSDVVTAVAGISIAALDAFEGFLSGINNILSGINPEFIRKVGEAFGILFGVRITMSAVTAMESFIAVAATIPARVGPSVLAALGSMATKLGAVAAAAYYAHRALSVNTSEEDMLYDPGDPKGLIDEYAASLYELNGILGLTDEQAETLSDALIEMKKNMVAGNAEPTAQAIAQAFADAGIEAKSFNGYLEEMYPRIANISAGSVPTTQEVKQWDALLERQEAFKAALNNAMDLKRLDLSAYAPIDVSVIKDPDKYADALDRELERQQGIAKKISGIIKTLTLTDGQASDLTRTLTDAGVMGNAQEAYDLLSKKLAELGVGTSQLTMLFKQEFPEAVYTAKQSSLSFLDQKFEPVTVSFATNLPEVTASATASIGKIKEAYLDLSSYSGQIDSLYSATTGLVQGLALPTETLTHLNNVLLDASLASSATLQSVYDTLVAEMQSMGLETDQLTESFEKAFPNAVRTAKEAVDPLATSAKDAGEKTGGLWDKITSFSLGAALKAVQMKLISSATKTIGDNSDKSAGSLGTLQDKVASLASTLKAKVKDYASGSKEIGDAIPAGIKEGIESGEDSVISAATNLANDGIIDPITGALDINSPSKVLENLASMADEGAALGLMDGISDVAAASAEVADALVDPFRTVGSQIRAALGDWFGIGRSAAESLAAGLMATYIPVPHLGIASWTQNFLNAEQTAWFNTPNYRVDWYAKGGIFTTPTIAGFGEDGAEAALPLTNRRSMSMIADAIVGAGGGSFGLTKRELVDAVEMGVAMGLAQNPQTIEILVNSVLQTEDETLARSVSRGRAKLDQRYSTV